MPTGRVLRNPENMEISQPALDTLRENWLRFLYFSPASEET